DGAEPGRRRPPSPSLDRTVDRLRALRKGVDHRIGDGIEYGHHGTANQAIDELVVQRELNLAGTGTQRVKMPGAVERSKRPVDEPHFDLLRKSHLIARRKVRPDAAVINIDAGVQSAASIGNDRSEERR